LNNATINKKILLVEDDQRLADLIKAFLTQNSFDVTHVSDGNLVLHQVAELEPDVILLDIMLPGTDGFSLCRSLRPNYTKPILFLTAKNSDIDQVFGLELGADDYVIKPIEPRVLLARINALLRRMEPISHNETCGNYLLQFGQLFIDKRQMQVKFKHETIPLTSHEFELLWLLAVQAGNPLSREQIHVKLIGREYDGIDRSVDVRISRLRKKLLDDPKMPYRIKTIWGKGYQLVPGAWE